MQFFKRAVKTVSSLETAIEAEDSRAVQAAIESGAKIKVKITNSPEIFDYRRVAELTYRKSGSQKAREIFEYLNSIQRERALAFGASANIPVHPRSPRAGR